MNLVERIANSDLDASRSQLETRLESFRGQTTRRGRLDDRHPELPANMSLEQGIPVVRAEDLTLEHMIAAMEQHGTLMVRGLLDADRCRQYRDLIDEVLDAPRPTAKNKLTEAETRSAFHNAPRNLGEFFEDDTLGKARGYHRLSGTSMCIESAATAEDLLALYEELGLKSLMRGYLQDEPCVSAQKWVLRRTPLNMKEADWHQDGAFMGDDIRSLNMWLALSDCGGDSGASGLDIIPQRIREVFQSPEGIYDWSLSPEWLRANNELAAFVSPDFQAGDAIFFDHFSLHRTQYCPEMVQRRYAIETWFFASQGFPPEQVPMAW